MDADTRNIDFGKKCIFFLIPIGIVFLIVEILFRLGGYKPLKISEESHYPKTPEAYFWVSDKYLGFRNQANGSFRYDYIKGSPVSTTDKLGFRNGFGWTPEGDSSIILLLGDSIVFGAEVNDDQTISSETAKSLSPDFNVRVLNAGIRGANTVQVKRMLEECFERFPTIKVVVYIYCFNDYPHNLNPYFYAATAPTAMWDEEEQQLVERNVENPLVPWGKPFSHHKDQNHKNFMVLNDHSLSNLRLRFTNFLRAHSAVLHQVGLRIRKILGPKMSENAETVPKEHNRTPSKQEAFPKIDMNAPADVIDKQLAEQIIWAQQHHGDKVLEMLLQQMEQHSTSHGATFLATSYSLQEAFSVEDTHSHQLIRQLYQNFPNICTKAGVKFIDISKAFTDPPYSYMSRTNSGDYDKHYGHKGAKIFAKAILPELQKLLMRKLQQ